MKKKIVILMILACMITQNTVYADVLENQEHTSADANTSVNVSANIFASFTVTLPKQIQIDQNTKSSGYTVKVEGDIPGNTSISVTPESSFVMEQVGKADITGSSEQNKTEFTENELTAAADSGVTAAGTVNVPDLTPGHWEGVMNFNVDTSATSGVNESKLNISGYEYTVDRRKHIIELNTYTGTEENVTIPAAYTDADGYKWKTSVGKELFKNNKAVKTVAFEKGTIAESSISQMFEQCTSVQTIDMSGLNMDNVSDMSLAFEGCSNLTAVTFGENTLPKLRDTSFTFNSCTNLLNLDLSRWNMNELNSDKAMFQFCRKLASIKLPEYVNRLDNFMFNHADAVEGETFAVPKGVKYVGNTHVFYNFGKDVQFKSFEMQEGDTDSILTTYGGNWKNYKSLYTSDMKTLIAIPRSKNDHFPTYWMPEGVTDMIALSFSRNQNICGVKIPNSFIIKQTLDEVGNKGTNLHVGIYEHCSAYYYLVKSDNPNYCAIGGCIYNKEKTKLIAVPFKYNGAAADESRYYSSAKDNTLTIPEGVTEIGEDSIYADGVREGYSMMGNLKRIIIPSTLTVIPDDQLNVINTLLSKGKITVTIADGNNSFAVENNQLVRK